jgi:hypothetical protein
MGFFDQLPPEPLPEPEPPTPPQPVWLKPEAVLPSAVAAEVLVAHTDAAAVAVNGLRAFPNGFEFNLTVVLRHEDRGERLFSPGRQHHVRTGQPLAPEFLRLGLQFSDGSVVSNLGPHPFTSHEAEPAGPILLPSGGGGGGRHYDMRHWVWPLPPDGPVIFVCQWPALGIEESRGEVDARLILDAAERSIQLWPDEPQTSGGHGVLAGW